MVFGESDDDDDDDADDDAVAQPQPNDATVIQVDDDAPSLSGDNLDAAPIHSMPNQYAAELSLSKARKRFLDLTRDMAQCERLLEMLNEPITEHTRGLMDDIDAPRRPVQHASVVRSVSQGDQARKLPPFLG